MALLMGPVGLLLGGEGSLRSVLGRGVDGVEHQRLLTGVAEVVLRSGRDGALVTGLDGVGVALQVRVPGPADEGQDLVAVLVRPERY